MTRKPKRVDEQMFKRIVREIDSPDLPNRSELYRLVSKKYNNILLTIKMGSAENEGMVSDLFPSITASIAMSRIKDWGIPIRTPIGARGRPKGIQRPENCSDKPRQSTTRAEKFANNPKSQDCFDYLEQECPEKIGWINKIKNGSLKYAMKYHCFTCSGFSASDSLHCDHVGCPFWLFLPRKERDG